MNVKIDIPDHVMKAFQQELDKLKASVQSNIMRAALRAAAKPVLANMKASVPVDTGDLKKSLYVSISTDFKNQTITAKVGSKNSRGNLLHLIEKGTAAHIIQQPKLNRSIMHPGAKAKPFMAKSLYQASSEATKAFKSKFKESLLKQYKKGAKILK